jgi:hypothetical protein
VSAGIVASSTPIAVSLLSSGTSNWTGTGVVDVGIGGTATAGNLLIGVLVVHQDNTCTTEASMSVLVDEPGRVAGQSSYGRVVVYYKIAAGGETTVPMQANGSQRKAGFGLRVAYGATFGNYASSNSGVTATQDYTGPTLVTSLPNEVVFHCFGSIKASGTPTAVSVESSTTAQSYVVSSQNRIGIVAYETYATAGTTTARSTVVTGTSTSRWAAVSFALRPT